MTAHSTLIELFNDSTQVNENETLAFAEVVTDILLTAQVLEVPIITDFDAKIGNFRYLINFYELETDQPELVLGTVFFNFENQSIILLKNDIDKYFSYLKNFVTNSLTSAMHKKLMKEGFSEIADLSESIYNCIDTISKIKLIFATNLEYSGRELNNEKLLNKEIQYDIWDSKRFLRFLTSGVIAAPIEINVENYGEPLRCLKVSNDCDVYDSYLTFFSGSFLEKIYDEYGTRLLERNVRAFLQTRGKINSAIQKTIEKEPEYFLAYNNGLTITCDEIDTSRDLKGNEQIIRINDFQIVNGGQTTASLWHAKKKIKDIKLDKIQIIAKINLLKVKNQTEQLTSFISLYSNSQNKVNKADPWGNKDYYRTLEKISKSVSTPESVPKNPGTKWFYERVRGGYAEEKNRKKNLTEINKFIKEYPPHQRVEKSQGAKLENTWKLLPFYVSKGAEWNFLKHSESIEDECLRPDEIYFKRLIAKQIIWKKSEKIISDQKIPGYRANILTYTLAIIIELTGNKIDLLKIWNEQDISERFEECINRISYEVRDIITGSKGNVTEYCKKELCWKNIHDKITSLPNEFDEILKIGLDSYVHSEEFQPIDRNIEFVMSIPAQSWKNLASWGKHTGLLENFEKGICMSLAKRLDKHTPPTKKQAFHGKKIFNKATQNGYK